MSGFRSTTRCSSKKRVRYHVANTSRPFTARTWRFLKMSDSAMSSSTGEPGMQKRTTEPPFRTMRNASRTAVGAPDISNTTSRPSPSFCARNHAGTSTSSPTSTATAPRSRASASRKGTWSEARTRPAPEARASAIANSPTGPQPRKATVRPGRSCVDVAKTALPNGSCRVAISGGSFARSFCQTTLSGTRTYSANAPSTSTPRMRVRSHMCACPVRQWKHIPQVMWLSAETKSPRTTVRTSSPVSTTVPANSWPSVSGGSIRACAHSSHRKMWRSVPQTLAASTWTSTSVGPGSGIGTRSSARPGSAARLRIAHIVSTAERIAGVWERAIRSSPDVRPEDRAEDERRAAAAALQGEGRRADQARDPRGAAPRDRRGRLQHVPPALRRRVHRPPHRQRHVRDVAGAARGDGARRRGVCRVAELLPPRPVDARRLRVAPPRADAPGTRRRAPACARARRAGTARALEPLLHDLARPRGARRRDLDRRLDPGGVRPDVPAPVQGEHRRREAARADHARGPRADRVRAPGGVPEHGGRPAVLAREPAGGARAHARARRPVLPRRDAVVRERALHQGARARSRRPAAALDPARDRLARRRRDLLLEEGPLRPDRRLPRHRRRRRRA